MHLVLCHSGGTSTGSLHRLHPSDVESREKWENKHSTLHLRGTVNIPILQNQNSKLQIKTPKSIPQNHINSKHQNQNFKIIVSKSTPLIPRSEININQYDYDLFEPRIANLRPPWWAWITRLRHSTQAYQDGSNMFNHVYFF